MLSGSFQKDEQNMGHMTNIDVNLDNHSSKSHVLGQHMKSHSIFNVPCLFVGLGPKSLLDSDSVRSPTSPLDARVLSNLSNPVRTPRSILTSEGGNHRSWDCCKVGLSIIDSLEDCPKFSGKILRSSESKNISVSPEMIIKTPNCQTYMYSFESSKSLPKDFCKAPYTKNGSTFHKDESSVLFEIGESSLDHELFGKIRSCSLESSSPLKTLSGLTDLDTDNNFALKDKDRTIQMNSPHFFGGSQNLNSNTLSISSSNDFIKSLSASEIELSEDYTCVISHGPNPKTTHIFGDCILETHSNEFKNHFKNEEKEEEEEKEKGGVTLVDHTLHTPHTPIQYPSSDFLSFCYHCNKKLLEGKDIYIYRGEKSFCSLTCRAMEIMSDEELEKSSTLSEKPQEAELGEQIFEISILTAT
ncbi:putative Zf-FLZ domain-containing protein [Lupinus albus]|uniref:Putative Zf-FLZ domain-containing protein n=1 Tax=Lupinus albus TaxID=3870 RepID=A0A6A4Q734_LUPAL|nr:putative Zf-FLZ domain-containing protein [Lupinus albus]